MSPISSPDPHTYSFTFTYTFTNPPESGQADPVGFVDVNVHEHVYDGG